MKILIAYYTSTKNTEKIARAIRNDLTDHEVELLDVEFDTKPIGGDLNLPSSDAFAFRK